MRIMATASGSKVKTPAHNVSDGNCMETPDTAISAKPATETTSSNFFDFMFSSRVVWAFSADSSVLLGRHHE
jgi:hypothetical protein